MIKVDHEPLLLSLVPAILLSWMILTDCRIKLESEGLLVRKIFGSRIIPLENLEIQDRGAYAFIIGKKISVWYRYNMFSYLWTEDKDKIKQLVNQQKL